MTLYFFKKKTLSYMRTHRGSSISRDSEFHLAPALVGRPMVGDFDVGTAWFSDPHTGTLKEPWENDSQQGGRNRPYQKLFPSEILQTIRHRSGGLEISNFPIASGIRTILYTI